MSGIVLGWSELEHADADARIARGAFRPADGYELVQDIFRLPLAGAGANGGHDPDALARYRRARDALGLQLVDDAGRAIAPVTLDVHPLADGVYELEAAIGDPAYWRALD
jgi:hypothetical protein